MSKAASGKRPQSGLLVILSVFAFGGLFLSGLYYTAWRDTPPEYRKATAGVPPKTLRFVSCNLNWNRQDLTRLLEELKPNPPDFLLLQRLFRKDAQDIAITLNLRVDGELQMFYSPSNADTAEEAGNAVLSRHRLYKGRSMPTFGPTDLGVWVESVIENRRFEIGCVDLQIAAASDEIELARQSWKKGNSPPVVIAGLFPSSSAVALPLANWMDTNLSLVDPADHQLAQRALISDQWRLVTTSRLATQPISADALTFELGPAANQ